MRSKSNPKTTGAKVNNANIPNGWELQTLGEVCKFEYGKPLKATERNESGEYPVFGSNGIVGYHDEYLVEAPFIIVGRKGSAGSVAYSKGNGFPIDTTFYIKCDRDVLDTKYLYEVLRNMKLEEISMQSGVPGLNRSVAYLEKIPLPPLPEQKAISNILQTWDTAIEKTETLVAAKEKQFDWLRSRLINSSNASREILGTLANISSGGTPKSTVPEFYGGEIPWVSIADMTERGMWINSTDRTLTKAGLDNSSAKIYPPNTVLYAMYASIGECSIASVELSSSQAILGIRPDPEKLHFEYLYYYLNSLKERIKLLGQWGTQSNLNAGMVKEFKIPLPPLPEQKRIAETLNTARQEIGTLKTLVDQYRTQKRGLMQKLLTGKWRVKV